MKRVLVTGASGFIGLNSLPLLKRLGYEVHAVSGSQSLQPGDGAIKWHSANLLNTGDIESLLSKVKPTHLLHFAWYAIPGKFWTAHENLDWVRATIVLMRAFSNQGGQRAVMAGTCAEYDWSFDFCSEETTPCRPTTLYGTCKHSIQLLLDAWSVQEGMSSAWGRIFFLYGPREHSSRLVPHVIRSLVHGEPAKCTHGEQVRDFMHVEDVAAAFVALLDSKVRGIVNIASGEPLRLKDMIREIADQIGRRELVLLGAIQPSSADPPRLVAEISRLHDEVGFRPVYNLNSGITQTIEHLKASEIP